MQLVIFVILALVTLGAAVMVVTTQNLLRSALWLVLAFFGIAGIFVLLNAEFLAVVQVLVYVGAIATLIIFGIMLTRECDGSASSRASTTNGVWSAGSRRCCSWRWRPSSRASPGLWPPASRPPTPFNVSARTSSAPMSCRSRSRRCCWSSR